MLATLVASQNGKAIDSYVPCVNIDAKPFSHLKKFVLHPKYTYRPVYF
jgi:hypothetical protein